MKDFFKYLTSGNEDKSWGLYMTVAGRYTSAPGSDYPRTEHPTGYYFEWDTWRVLSEFQLVYITDGAGILQAGRRTHRIKPGTVMLIRPGVRHRYRPDTDLGWTENYVGFTGNLANHFVDTAFAELTDPLIHCENQFELMDTFQKINQVIIQQQPSYQKICSGLLLKLIGYIESQIRSQKFRGKEVSDLINDAKNFMWENVDEDINLEAFSRQNHVSYSYFRKVFKIYTGIPPHQFFLDLKIVRARELLIATDIPVKEISYRLGFNSIQYFSRLFKRKTGFAPSAIRLRK